MLFSRIYYQFKPFLPSRLRLAVRRHWSTKRRARFSRVWPIDEAAGVKPAGWSGWPQGKKFALVLTHDVEGQLGLDNCPDLMNVEEQLGVRSSFNFIPEGEYNVSSDLRRQLAERGFEIGVHDLAHDGKLFQSRKGFPDRAARINKYLSEWGAVGFRSGFMLRNLDWITNLDIQYDASTFDTDPFEPQPDGAGTIFPFLVGNGCGREYVELPYTLAQDSTLFLTLGEKNIDVWKKKLDWIAERGGLALVNTHPDYMDFKGVGRNRRSYPIAFYRELLEYAQTRYAGQFWSALPREVAAWSRQSATLRPVSRKRVCMVAYSFYESDNRVMRYAEALAARGDHVDVLSLQRQQKDPVQQQINGVNVTRIQKRLAKNEKNKFNYLLRLVRFCVASFFRLSWRQLICPYDVVHVHNIPDFLVFSAWLARLAGARVILDLHDLVPEFYCSKFGLDERGRGFSALARVERWSASFANHVIISNHLWRERVVRRSVPANKCSVFVNYVDTQLFKPRTRERSDENLRVVFPGGLQWHQGLDVAIRAFKKIVASVPNAELHIYGDGAAKQTLMALALELGLERHVFFHDTVPLSRVPQLIADADLGIVPKRADSFGNEAFSTKIMEYMSQGVPVVLSRTKIDEFYFDPETVRFFSSGEADELAAAVIELYQDPRRCRTMVQRGFDYVARNSWESRKAEYLSLVDNLAHGISLPADELATTGWYRPPVSTSPHRSTPVPEVAAL
jgi:glycosyltransferase involved in cell wall biosynthesis/peptidoglycan/xylan/chitin deacetylase (PgdA/CDA1 family)